MIVYTDDVKYAQEILLKQVTWNSLGVNEVEEKVNRLANTLFEKKTIYSCNIPSHNFAEFIFIVNHASNSQFSILQKLSEENNQLQHGILCMAKSGRNFVGFKNRSWIGVPGNIHLSGFFSPQCPVLHYNIGFTIISAISVIQTMDSFHELKDRASIKWVNDIVIENSKIGGVLTLTQSQGQNVTGVIIGIGINVERTPRVMPDIYVPKVSNLYDFMKDRFSCNKGIVFSKLVYFLNQNYIKLLNGDYPQLLKFYRERSIIKGREVEIYSDPLKGKPQKLAEGKVISIGENLELILDGIDKPVRNGRLVLKN